MKKEKIKFIIIYLFIILILLIVALLLLLLNNESKDIEFGNFNKINDIEIMKEPQNVKEVLEKYDSEYLSQDLYNIYVVFGKDLYDDNGKSNSEYFYSILEDIKPFIENEITLIDEEKKITIKINKENDKAIFNSIENFYDIVDGESYVKVDNLEIVNKTYMHIESKELSSIVVNAMFIDDDILEKLGKQDEIESLDSYTSYENGKIKASKYRASNRFRNIIFSSEYEEEIMSGVKTTTSLGEIIEKYPNPSFGSVRQGYLGYRTDDVYIFFYNNEASVYGYSYKNNSKLEGFIEDYIETKDLRLFRTRMIVAYDNFYDYSYDEEKQELFISYPNIGLEINIKNNDVKGIKLYKNYYITERTKKLVKDGIIQLEPDVDYLEKIEKERVSGTKEEK